MRALHVLLMPVLSAVSNATDVPAGARPGSSGGGGGAAAPACRCTTCSGSERDRATLPHLAGCNLCGSASVTHGVVCLTTGLWRAEYCRACTRQQREDAVVCSRWHDDLYVEVVRRGAGRQGRFLSLRGRCGLCFRSAVYGCASGLSSRKILASDSQGNDARVDSRSQGNGSAVLVHRGAPRWCSRHRHAKHTALLAPTCTFVQPDGAACGRAATVPNASAASLWQSQHVACGIGAMGLRQLAGRTHGGGSRAVPQPFGTAEEREWVRLERAPLSNMHDAQGDEPPLAGDGGEVRLDVGLDEEEVEEGNFPVAELCVQHSRQVETSLGGADVFLPDAEQLWRTHLRPYLLCRRATEPNVTGNVSSGHFQDVHATLRRRGLGLEKVWRYSKCQYSEGCLRQPAFGLAGQRGRYCSLHRQANHTNLKSKLCGFAGGCSTAASFGPPKTKPIMCAKHRHPRHVDLRNRLRCKEAGCDGRARHKSAASLPADLCSKHRKCIQTG
eukprot:Tamp_09853.p1 GENE.Tamp_09853~~Tamp_09853.p1  ORF type:complete len:508 (+),score=54.15 Tamp_09853:25-1524(+)